MKKALLLLLATAVSLGLFAQEKLMIKGQIAGLENDLMILRYRVTTEDNSTTSYTDTIYAENGKIDFEKEIKITDPTYATLSYIGNKTNLLSVNTNFFLISGKVITLSGSITDFYNIHADGSPYFSDVLKLRNINNETSQAIMKLQKMMSDQKILGEEFVESLKKKMYEVWDVMEANQKKFVQENKNSVYAAFLKTQDLLGADVNELEAEYESFSDEAKNSVFGKQIKTYIEDAKKVAPGAQAPNFTQKDKEGKTITLKKYKGKYVLLDFWGSWCGPCRRSHPHLVELYNKYKDEKFVLIGLASDRDKTKWEKAIIDDNLTWPHINLYDKYKGEDVAKLYNVKAFPTKVLVDPQGKIVKTFIGSGDEESAQLDALLKDIFGK